ncbi:hypothetical protein LCGC14_1614540 [marine sediment metagenome]|uniref:Uncharacterized protein n=1 Tax=marine sediment metagenome TaxID=412755 RepID=A0A0F9IU21_9ZZZZ
MSRSEYFQEVIEYYRRQNPPTKAWRDLERVLMLIMDRDDVRLDPQAKRLSEAVERRIFGKRRKCPACGTYVLPGQLCWGCHGWEAPRGRM